MSAQHSTRSELHELVFEALERAEREGSSAIDALCAEHPKYAAALRRRLEALRLAGLVDEEGGTPIEIPAQVGEFRLLEPLGGGGMGVVYRAEQRSLGREVALKVIRPEHLFFPLAKERFRREVEIVARLAHPGIVPVYSVGEDGGLPYFAMEKVDGCTLADALRVLAGRNPALLCGSDLEEAVVTFAGGAPLAERPALFAGGWADTCLRITHDVAEALEHAHRNGVLHRDVKPSNVMITRDGRVMLLDFGLASVEDEGGLTRTGTRLGSLPYLAPEQVEGAAEFTRRADVYGLGVTLYELLTLELPFSGANQAALIQAISSARAVPVRRRNRAVSWEAETVCEVALERDPARRYASTGELARDIANVLERRPLAARRAGFTLRVKRWAQRHPALATAGALGFLILTVGPLVFGFQQAKAAERMTDESARALSFLERSLEAVEEMLVAVGTDEVAEVPFMARRREVLLRRAVDLCEEINAAQLDDSLEPEIRRLVARTQARARMGLASALYGLERYDEALEHWAVASELAQTLVAGEASDVEAVELFARVNYLHATTIRETKDLAQAAGKCEAGLAALASLPEGAAFNEDVESTRADLMALRSLVKFDRGDREGALADVRIAASIARATAARVQREDGKHAARLGRVLNMQGACLLQHGEEEEAESVLLEAERALDGVLLHAVDAIGVRGTLVNVRGHLMLIAWRKQDWELARERCANLLGLQRGLALSFPDSLAHAEEYLRGARRMAGLIAREPDSDAEAYALLERAMEHLKSVRARYPGVGSDTLVLARAASDLGHYAGRLERFERAEELYEHSTAQLRLLQARQPQSLAFMPLLGQDHRACADVLLAAGRHADAAERVRRGLREVLGVPGHARASAELLARCHAAAAADTRLEVAQRDAAAEACAADALESLTQAIALGEVGLELLDSADWLAGLRGRAGYPALRARVLELGTK